jgi:hypothetical protein
LLIESARAIGNGTTRMLFVHLLPNSISGALTQISVRMAWAIRVSATLAVVGIGIQQPTPEWGAMIEERWAVEPAKLKASLRTSGRRLLGLVALKDRFDIAWGNDADVDRHGIVTPSVGLMNPNHYLAVAIDYLCAHRSGWAATAAVGKTLVSRVTKDTMSWPLRHKGFSMQTSGFCGEIIIAYDSQTSAICPTIKIADVSNRTIDMPMLDNPAAGTNYVESLDMEKSLWGAELSKLNYIKMSSGPHIVPSSVQLAVNASGVTPKAADPATGTAAPKAAAAPMAKAMTPQGVDINDLTDQAKDWISKPENQAQAKSWLSQAWTWISGLF